MKQAFQFLIIFCISICIIEIHEVKKALLGVAGYWQPTQRLGKAVDHNNETSPVRNSSVMRQQTGISLHKTRVDVDAKGLNITSPSSSIQVHNIPKDKLRNGIPSNNTLLEGMIPEEIQPKDIARKDMPAHDISLKDITSTDLPPKIITPNDTLPKDLAPEVISHNDLTPKDILTKDMPPTTKPPKNIPKAKYDVSEERSYLFPLHFDSNGPNVQYTAFRKGVAFAMFYKRTIVEMWFYSHWTSGSHTRHFLNETIDMKKLREITDIATLDVFKKDCNNTIDIVLMDPFDVTRSGSLQEFTESYIQKQRGLEKRYGIILPNASSIPNTKEKALFQLAHPPSTRCLGILEPGHSIKWTFPNYTSVLGNVDSHLLKPDYIRKMAIDVNKKLCGGDGFMALHWRNRSGESCGRGKECLDIMKVVEVNRTAKVVANDIRNYMMKHDISCLYVAMPPFARVMLTILKNANVSQVKTFDDISTSEYPEIVKIKDDGFLVSLLEQEICARSKVFLATTYSSWSRIPSISRSLLGNKTLTLTKFASWISPLVSLK